MESIKEGIFRSSVLNLLSRIFGYLRYVVIAYLFGLNNETDAFFFAYALVGIMLVFVDVFDSLGVPQLVKARQKGEDEFNKVASSLFTFTVICSLFFGLVLLFTIFLLYFFKPEIGNLEINLITKNMLLLIPFALSGFFIHYFGALLRSIRRFTVYFTGELIYSAISFFLILTGLLFVKDSAVLSLSISLAQIIYLSYIILASKQFFKLTLLNLKGVSDYAFTFLFLSILYGIFYLFTIVDKFFASLLEPKSISAISYGLLVAGAVKGMFKIEQVIITKISEVNAEPEYIVRILSVISAFSVLMFAFIYLASRFIVQVLFGYGEFSKIDVELTSEALRYYSLSIPFFFLWPIVFRIYQVKETLFPVFIFSLVSIIINIVLNYYFVVIAKMGIMGICLGTFGAYGFLTISSLIYLIPLLRRKSNWR